MSRTTQASRSLLECLFNPRGVALIGSSDNPDKVSGRPLRYLRRGAFGGRVYPVNPTRSAVQGEKSYKSIQDIDGPIDHAYILLGSDAAVESVAMCAEAGVPIATVLADGFAEAGDAGRARQAKLKEIVDTTGIRIVGPNSMGTVDTERRFICTTNAAFASIEPKPGRFSVLSQSGTVLGALLSRGASRNMFFSTLTSLGNEVDLDVGEIGEALVDHGETDCFILFLETIRHPERLARFARAARERGKPIIAYKLGRSQVGQQLAVSHTGAVVGNDVAAECFLEHHGIVRVDQFETMLALPPLALAAHRIRKTRPLHANATVISATGGGGALVIDLLAAKGVHIRGLRSQTRTKLSALGIQIGTGILVDVSLAGANYDTMKTALSSVALDEATGVVVVVLGSSAEASPQETVRPIVDAVREAGDGSAPVIVFLVPEGTEAGKLLGAAGIVTTRTPESCAEAVALALREPEAPAIPTPLTIRNDVIEAIDEADGPVMTESEAGRVFEVLGIARAATRYAPVGTPIPECADLHFPVAAKLVSADLPHKSEAGAVTLNIAEPSDLHAVIERMNNRVATRLPDVEVSGILIQEMVVGLMEVAIGLIRDPSVGPIITLAVGGTLTELHRDRATRVAPVAFREARAMIEDVRALAVIRGYRGAPRGDLDALAEAIVSLSSLAVHDNIIEAEINPLMVMAEGSGVVAVDGLICKAARLAE